LKEPVEAIVQDDPAEIDASDRDKQEQQQFQQDLMHHHRLLMKQYIDLMEHHCLVQELYSNLIANPSGTRGYDHVLQEYHQALREHHRMVEALRQVLQDHYQLMQHRNSHSGRPQGSPPRRRSTPAPTGLLGDGDSCGHPGP
jgi:hypothetical protein